uniref:Uncharacterized protein n=1 Tax=Oryza rufipogon TaxID=4529 RepID=A0A0E0QKX6_ORYRU
MVSRTAAAASVETSRCGSRTAVTAPELQMASRTAATATDWIEDNDGGGGSRAPTPPPLPPPLAPDPNFLLCRPPFRGYSLHATLARRCAPAAASLALYSHIREASPPTPFIFSLLLAALASSSSPPSYPSAGFACLAAVCVAHAQAFKCNVLAHPIITPPDGAMEIAAVYDDCACARAVEVHRQEEYEEIVLTTEREREGAIPPQALPLAGEGDEVGNGDEEGGRG